MSEYTENVAEKSWLELMGEYTTQMKIVDISRKRNVVVAEKLETDGYEQEEAVAGGEKEGAPQRASRPQRSRHPYNGGFALANDKHGCRA